MYYIYRYKDTNVNLFAFDNTFKLENINFSNTNGVISTFFNNEILEIELGTIYIIDNIKFMVLKADRYIYNINNYPVLLNEFGDIKLNNINASINHNLLSSNNEINMYLNYQFISSNSVNLEIGDVIIIDNYVLIYGENRIISIGKPLPTEIDYFFQPFITSYSYQTSPKTNKYLDDVTIKIKSPGEKPKMAKAGIMRIIIPPLVTIGASIALAIITKRGIMVLISIVTTICALFFSATAFINERADLRRKIKFREKSYTKYLLGRRKKLFDLKRNEQEYYTYKFPSIDNISKMIISTDERLYERIISDDDFLTISLGYYDSSPTYHIEYEDDELKYGKDDLYTDANVVYNKFNKVCDVPQIIDLKSNNLGLIGDKNLIHDELKRIIMDLSFFQSYHDLNMVLLTDQMYNDDFKFVDWLPHFKIENLNLNTHIVSEQMKEIVLGSIYNILRNRKISLEQNEKDTTFIPHIILIIDDLKLIINHPIMEYLTNNQELGVSLIVGANETSDLLNNIDSVYLLKDKNNGLLRTIDTIEVNRLLRRDVKQDDNYDQLSRELAKIDHKVGIDNSIPNMVDFLEIFDAKTVSDLEIKKRWESSNIHKSINVPLGKKTVNEKLYLNLHEKAHGPHGLVAGTTGSGKSEIIQSYILSLAVTFSPYEVGFLLIDFKGGGMANLFTDLPHLIGTITNLDGSESMRALSSIKSELKRRQKIFNDHNVNNINLYNALFKNGKANEPLPHLFIISDEFAELKKEQPEFMSELVSVARIGRTLGVHLILATQKPSGVVDEQIWSNSKFKLALKVQDEADSKEMLKTPDAAHITQTGRAYLQVGNNEIYELFQSAWSGALYNINNDNTQIDNNIYEINNLGQKVIINEDLSINNKEKEKTQLAAVIEEICKVYQQSDYQPVTKAWLPSLKTEIIKSLNIKSNLEKINNFNSEVLIGLLDFPAKQKQIEYKMDINKDPNLLVYGGSGYGKTKVLENIIMSLSSVNNPQILQFYILDFGNAGLINYRNLSHVVNYISFDSIDKISRLKNRINKTIIERKRILSENNVNNIRMYEELTSNSLPRIVIAIDNYEVLSEIDEDFNKFLETISRDSTSLGISFIISTNKVNAIKPGSKNNFNHVISLYMNEQADINDAVGKGEYPLNGKVKGRCLVKFDNVVSQMQLYVCSSCINEIEYNKKITELISNINDNYHGDLVKKIQDVSEDFNTNEWNLYDYANNNHDNIVGITTLNLEKIGIEKFNDIFIVCGPTRSGKTNFIKILLSYHPDSYVIDNSDMDLIDFNNENYRYVNNEEDFLRFVNVLEKLINNRLEECNRLVEEGVYKTPKEYVKNVENKYIFIDDYDDFIQRFVNDEFINLLNSASNLNIILIIGMNSTTSKSTIEPLYKLLVSSNDGVVLGEERTFCLLNLSPRDVPSKGNGVLSVGGEYYEIRIPRFEKEKKDED